MSRRRLADLVGVSLALLVWTSAPAGSEYEWVLSSGFPLTNDQRADLVAFLTSPTDQPCFATRGSPIRGWRASPSADRPMWIESWHNELAPSVHRRLEVMGVTETMCIMLRHMLFESD